MEKQSLNKTKTSTLGDTISIMNATLPKCKRIIVIGDVHGDYELCIKILTEARVIKIKDKMPIWVAEKDTIVVQVGDQIDSCRPSKADGIVCSEPSATLNDKPDDWKVMELFTQLNKLALRHDGMVISLLGNHEILNSLGDIRYVSYANLQEFKNNKYLNPKRYKSGKKARIHAFKPKNHLAVYLANNRVSAVVIGSNLFVHAGILPETASKYTLDDLNTTIRNWLLGKFTTKKDKAVVAPLLISNTKSPFWPRHFGVVNDRSSHPSTETICKSLLEPVLKQYNVKRMIVGHTPQSFQQLCGINSACNDKLWRVDTGSAKMFNRYSTSHYDTHRTAQFLQIDDDNIITVGKYKL